MNNINMTWEELVFAQVESPCLDVATEIIAFKSMRFSRYGEVSVRTENPPFIAFLQTNRTPYQMYQMIKALTEKEIK